MQKGRLYTIIGVDGLTLGRKNGIGIKIDSQSFMVDGFDADVEMEILELISDDIDSFMTDGLNLLVELDTTLTGDYIVSDIIATADVEDADGEEDDWDDDEDDAEFGYETDGPYATEDEEE